MSCNKNELEREIKNEYDGNQGLVWELLFGRHIHTGGWYSTQDLATKAGITPNMRGIEFCCNNGESMRFLVRNRGVIHMTGIDISAVAVQRGRDICLKQGFMDNKSDESRIRFITASVTEPLSMLNDAQFDFLWAEDGWCYIDNKAELIKTATRLLKPGGTIAFTDWCLGANHKEMTDAEQKRLFSVSTFVNFASIENYSEYMRDAGFHIVYAHDTKRWIPCQETMVAMMENQFKGDILNLLNGDTNQFDELVKDFNFMLELGKQGKLCQGLFVGKKNKKGGKPISKL